MTCTREQLVVGGEFVDGDSDMLFTVTAVGRDKLLATYTDETGVSYEVFSEFDYCLKHWTPHDPRADWRLDDLLVVWNEGGYEHLRYFAGISGGGKVECFEYGATSLYMCYGTTAWPNARLATPEDIERLSPKPESWWAKKREG